MALSGAAIRAAVKPQLTEFIRRGWSPTRVYTHLREELGRLYNRQTFFDDFLEAKSAFDFRPIWKELDPTQPVMREHFAPRTSAVQKRYIYEYEYTARDPITGEISTGHATFTDDKRLSPAQAQARAQEELAMLQQQCPPLAMLADQIEVSAITGYFEVRDPQQEAGRRARRTARGDLNE